ncbi:hypothetical protein [Akkermansia glycaniphila]|uniref:Uncharacterized protein n=1 Tax=Akkermansia glycaniphila TaxID=1679444 RepID=A0A1C7P9K7_9BACT|nr:hypothetical protein [Akkermansia glycaniphila]OCA02165.1 hypothetical protein AC781_11430 [Akkermansia glycaniphila]SEH99598.1 Hypothetical protein PYTT_2411 [Akkermansia glycaniphila]
MTIPTPFRPTGGGPLYQWTQPPLIKPGTWGGGTIAARASNVYIGYADGWTSFTPMNVVNQCWMGKKNADGSLPYLELWYPAGLVLRTMYYTNVQWGCQVKKYSITGITASGEEIDLGTYTNTYFAGNQGYYVDIIAPYDKPCVVIRWQILEVTANEFRFFKIDIGDALTPASPEQQNAYKQ